MRCTLAVFCGLRLLHNVNATVYFGKTLPVIAITAAMSQSGLTVYSLISLLNKPLIFNQCVIIACKIV